MLYGLCAPLARYDALADIGYDYVELSGVEVSALSLEEVRRAAAHMKSREIPCLGFNSYCNAGLPIVGPGFREADVRAYARQLFEKGAILGIHFVGIGSPAARRLASDYPREIADRQAECFLQITAEEASVFGIQVLLESLNNRMCEYLTSTPQAVEMVQRLAIKNLGIVLDFYHMAMMGEDFENIIDIMPYVEHLHISGYDMDGKRRQLRENERNFCARCLRAVKKTGYDKTISIEATPQDFVEETSRSLRIIRSLV